MAQRFSKAVRTKDSMSQARVYADVNVNRPKDYWDYETLSVQWGYVLNSRSAQLLLVPDPMADPKVFCAETRTTMRL